MTCPVLPPVGDAPFTGLAPLTWPPFNCVWSGDIACHGGGGVGYAGRGSPLDFLLTGDGRPGLDCTLDVGIALFVVCVKTVETGSVALLASAAAGMSCVTRTSEDVLKPLLAAFVYLFVKGFVGASSSESERGEGGGERDKERVFVSSWVPWTCQRRDEVRRRNVVFRDI